MSQLPLHLGEFLSITDKGKTCCAVSNSGVTCDQTKATHKNYHFCTQDGTMKRSNKRTLRLAQRNWSGNFVDDGTYDSEAKLRAIFDSTLQELEDCLAQNPSRAEFIFLAFKKSLWANAVGGIANLIKTEGTHWIHPTKCLYCSNASDTSGKCGHRISCYDCHQKITNFPPELTIISQLTNRAINLSVCPICSQIY
jgi:hypothetical protein